MEKMDGRCAEASFFQNSSKRNSALGTELVKDREAVNDGADICGEGRMERRASAFAAEFCSIILE